jgi:hypothetical protein
MLPVGLNPQPLVYKTNALPIELRKYNPLGWNRTNNQSVMSRLLYLLSYQKINLDRVGFEPTVLSTMVFKTIALSLSATC